MECNFLIVFFRLFGCVVISLGILIGLYVLCSLAAAIYAAVKKLKKTLQEDQDLIAVTKSMLGLISILLDPQAQQVQWNP